MIRYDRLSALIARFEMRVVQADPGTGNLRILGDADTGTPSRMTLRLRGPAGAGPAGERPLIEAAATWGGDSNPLLAALPACVSLAIDDDDTRALVRFLIAEAQAKRCGSGVVLSRLAEVLVVRMLRAEIERGSTEPGLVAGLADPRLSRAIVAMHEEPGQGWSSADLAEVAGMSLSRFAEAFRTRVGETPMAYLRRWRMTLARQDLDRGHRVQAVARRYGYGSSEALARAFQRQHGVTPLAARRSAAATPAP
ncbi:AraC family transcriptional regulator [Thalassobaculum fulvum]|uniref:AraC family transcriptional regulator n=1 Tax=Thalassobaculum fulvum TaxID=1633335 RepID=A0A919CQ97_9PROT|nr:AraC family transcriptional regulator [Thalassobaculum fulvum]GHD51418.1 AraC family transcriptional regulator [Thalassobaculum fulvum]